MRRRLAGLAVVLLAVAFTGGGCGDDDDDPAGPVAGDVAGVWNYSAAISGSGLTCSISGVRMTLTQDGARFTGVTSGGTIACSGGGVEDEAPLEAAQVLNGRIEGDRVTFDIDTSDFQHDGTLSDNSIDGSVEVRLDLGEPIGVYVLTGNFSTVRP